MKLVALSIAAAALASACASTAPQQQLAANAKADCSTYRTTKAVAPSTDAIEATAHCSSAPWLTPERLHDRVNAESQRLRNQNIR